MQELAIIIATAGEEPAGIIESIKKFSCDKLILVADERAKKTVVPKVKETARSLNLTTEVITIDPYNVIDTVGKLKELIQIHKEDNIIINITDGRKTMAIAGAIAGIVSGDKVDQVIYITEETHEVISIPRLLNPDKLLRPEKREILKILSQKGTLTAEELRETIGSQMQVTWKHLRELEEIGYVESSGEKPKKYQLTESGWLLA